MMALRLTMSPGGHLLDEMLERCGQVGLRGHKALSQHLRGQQRGVGPASAVSSLTPSHRVLSTRRNDAIRLPGLKEMSQISPLICACFKYTVCRTDAC